ncbi:MAG: TrmB family transcriptional regulator [Haloarculaceae archaeon]
MDEPDDMDETSLRRFLQSNVDMSEYESLVYLALITEGKQTMKEIAESSGVPKQRVYDTVETLRERGFVKLDDSYPKQAYAVEPTETLGPLQERIERVQSHLEELHRAVSDVESGVVQLESRSTIERYVSDLLSAAENTVFMLASPERVSQFETDLRSLADVEVRLIVSNLDRNVVDEDVISLPQSVEDLARYARGTVRSEPFVATVDRRSGFFWPDGSGEGSRADGAYYVTDAALAFLFDRFLSDSMWPLSHPVNTADDDATPDLPKEYFRIRDCLDDVQRLTQGVPIDSLVVSFDGYDTVSDEQISLTGTLTGFHYARYGESPYLELELSPSDDEGPRTVTVGGWRSSHEDYNAHRIELREREAWSIEELDDETRANVERCRSELPAESAAGEVVIGFDGYIDKIRQLVDERKSPRMYDEIAEFDTVGEMFAHAASSDRTLNFEWVERDRVPGGHTAHAGRSFRAFEYDLQLLGYFGQPIREEFQAAFADASLLSLGQPSVSEYVHFEDGKVLFTESVNHQALNWETLCEYVPLEDMAEHLDGTDLVSIGGWALIPEISTIWEGLREQVYPLLSDPPEDVVVLVTDVDHLSETTLRSDLESLRALDERIPVTAAITREQATHLDEVLLPTDAAQRSLSTTTTELREQVGVSRFAITSSRESVLATSDETFRARTPHVEDPSEQGTFEDHFAAGVALGRVEGLSNASTLVLGNAVAGYYQRNQEVPTIDEVGELLETYWGN